MGVYDEAAFRQAFYRDVLGDEGFLTMNGRDYIARTRLTAKDGTVLAMPGETCDRVPVTSLGWLHEQGLVERVRAMTVPVTEPARAEQ